MICDNEKYNRIKEMDIGYYLIKDSWEIYALVVTFEQRISKPGSQGIFRMTSILGRITISSKAQGKCME